MGNHQRKMIEVRRFIVRKGSSFVPAHKQDMRLSLAINLSLEVTTALHETVITKEPFHP
jgi:hypothetical protein